jgi:hypothetical protein
MGMNTRARATIEDLRRVEGKADLHHDTVSGASRDLLPNGMISKDAVVFGAPSRDGRTLAFIERTLDGDIWAMSLP